MQVPFVIGIFEFQLNRIDKEFADMVEEYAPTLMSSVGGFAPSLTRVVPVNAAIDGQHQIHRYEDVRVMLEKAKSFQLQDCICRKEAALQGHPCKHSVEVCLGLSGEEDGFEKYRLGRIISREEAMQVVAKAEEEGLVHTTYNVKSDHIYICNCCSCCCGVLRGVKYFNAPYLMAKSNFVARIDRDECAACGVCADERCPMKAITEENGSYNVLPERCIGCGVCTRTCPTGAINLTLKPETGRDEPPANLMEWACERATSRGIKIIV
jgi:electron transport complex protein RnfB